MIDVRGEFKILERKINNKPLVYLDSAATTLVPEVVINRLSDFYRFEKANVHRGVHELSSKATDAFEAARSETKEYISGNEGEVVFTKGTTESVNLVAHAYSELLNSEDEIVVSEMEHHSNLLPWQWLAKKTGATLKYIEIDDNGELELGNLSEIIGERCKIVAINYCSNTLGTVNPVEKIIARAKQVGAKVLLDAAQAVSAMAVDVSKLKCDFLAFSAHKHFGPFSCGVLYLSKEAGEQLPVFQTGGGMISTVGYQDSNYLESPQKFEAGTPGVAEVIAMAKSYEFVNQIGHQQIQDYEAKITASFKEQIETIEGVRVLGQSPTRINIVSFDVEGAHASDLGTLMNQSGVAVRTGHHCTQLILKKMKCESAVRASFSVYNDMNDVEVAVASLKKSLELLR